MLDPVTDHRHIIEKSSDMEMKRKSLFFKNKYRLKNQFSLKTVFSGIFLKKISKKIFFHKMSNLAIRYRQVVETLLDMETKRTSVLYKINVGFKGKISPLRVVSDRFLKLSLKIRHILKNWSWGPLDEISNLIGASCSTASNTSVRIT